MMIQGLSDPTPRLTIMNTSTAKQELIDRYVVLLVNGLPPGTLAPFKKWVQLLAVDLNVDQEVLMEEIRGAALDIYKLQFPSEK